MPDNSNDFSEEFCEEHNFEYSSRDFEGGFFCRVTRENHCEYRIKEGNNFLCGVYYPNLMKKREEFERRYNRILDELEKISEVLKI